MRTGLLFPEDYVENWGIKYGIGLGDKPISEALTNQYWCKKAIGHDGKEMYPVGVCLAPIQMVEVTDAVFKEGAAVLAIDDNGMNTRGAILRARQASHNKVAA